MQELGVWNEEFASDSTRNRSHAVASVHSGVATVSRATTHGMSPLAKESVIIGFRLLSVASLATAVASEPSTPCLWWQLSGPFFDNSSQA